MKKFLTLAVAYLFIGCSSHWVQEGKSLEETEFDAAKCYDGLIKQHDNPSGLSNKEINQFMSECMEQKGYHDKRRKP